VSSTAIVFAGFGGQGVLMAGKLLAEAGLLEGKNVAWIPSYGPEMRGGTANCTVVVADEIVGSPIVPDPDHIVVLNLPSLDKFEAAMRPGGQCVINSALIERKCERDDVVASYVPGNTIATEMGNPRGLNIVMLGAFVARCPDLVGLDAVKQALTDVFKGPKEKFLAGNLDALMKGYEAALAQEATA
jgi:2-oxoglutarate ferredoxin oxidoreductase subunit gamma